MGAYVGRTALREGRGVMVDYRYIDGAKVQPDDAVISELRPADATK